MFVTLIGLQDFVLAASMESCGTDCKPAKNTIIANGVTCQILCNIKSERAFNSLENQ